MFGTFLLCMCDHWLHVIFDCGNNVVYAFASGAYKTKLLNNFDAAIHVDVHVKYALRSTVPQERAPYLPNGFKLKATENSRTVLE